MSSSGCKRSSEVSPTSGSARPANAGKAVGFLKGQTHAHTGNSGDSRTPPADVVRFYRDKGYDFVVLTDHNFITGITDMNQDAGDLIVIAGAELTQNFRTCEPPPEPDGACLLHINSLFVEGQRNTPVAFTPPTDSRRVAIYQRAIDVTKKRGGLAQLNHPNMGWAVDAELLVQLAERGVVFVEIANQNEKESDRGDATHPSVESLWNTALSSTRLWGVATDDAHHYADAEATRAAGRDAFVGDLGWVMVRAAKNEAAIRRAMESGDFYSSTGVSFSALRVADGAIELGIEDTKTGPYVTIFIGEGGNVLDRQVGLAASYRLNPPTVRSRFVRARVEAANGDLAWTQPAFLANAQPNAQPNSD